jgi:hypothetical protein
MARVIVSSQDPAWQLVVFQANVKVPGRVHWVEQVEVIRFAYNNTGKAVTGMQRGDARATYRSQTRT